MIQELIILFGPCNAGKTTTSKRLALEYANKGLKVCICETDIYKKDEFKNEAWDNNAHNITVVDLFAHKTDYKVALNQLFLSLDIENNNYDILIIDTPGYHLYAHLIASMFKPLLETCNNIEALNKKYILVTKLLLPHHKQIGAEYQKAIPCLTHRYETHDNIYDIIEIKKSEN
jgi:signal recognition particle GTPase